MLTDNLALARIVESMRDWGRDCWCEPGEDNRCLKRFNYQMGTLPEGYDHKYIFSHVGYNLKATDIQAALGLTQLAKLDQFARRGGATGSGCARGAWTGSWCCPSPPRLRAQLVRLPADARGPVRPSHAATSCATSRGATSRRVCCSAGTWRASRRI